MVIFQKQCFCLLFSEKMYSFPVQSLIPDIKPSLGQEAVLDLHPEEMHLSGEEEGGERGDQDLKIRRTVTQVCQVYFCSAFALL